MTDQHPITPPPELLNQWADAWRQNKPGSEMLVDVATQAARWGADQELEAWCDFMGPFAGAEIRAARRPKPPSLKQQAQRILVENGTTLDGRIELEPDDIIIIRRALESLPD